MPRVGQNLQPFTGNSDVSIWMKNFLVGRLTNKKITMTINLIEQGNDNILLTVNIQYATTEAHLTSFYWLSFYFSVSWERTRLYNEIIVYGQKYNSKFSSSRSVFVKNVYIKFRHFNFRHCRNIYIYILKQKEMSTASRSWFRKLVNAKTSKRVCCKISNIFFSYQAHIPLHSYTDTVTHIYIDIHTYIHI